MISHLLRVIREKSQESKRFVQVVLTAKEGQMQQLKSLVRWGAVLGAVLAGVTVAWVASVAPNPSPTQQQPPSTNQQSAALLDSFLDTPLWAAMVNPSPTYQPSSVQQSCTFLNSPIVIAFNGVDASGKSWNYTVSNVPDGVTVQQVSMLAPACVPDLGYSGGTYPASVENYQDYLVTLAQGRTGTYGFSTQLADFSTRNGSAQIQLSYLNTDNNQVTDTAYCPNIAVPDCVSPVSTGAVAIIKSKITASNGASFCKQGGQVVDCTTLQPLPFKNLSDLNLDNNTLNVVQVPGLGPQDFVLQAGATATGDPTYYCVAGRCYYLVTPIP